MLNKVVLSQTDGPVRDKRSSCDREDNLLKATNDALRRDRGYCLRAISMIRPLITYAIELPGLQVVCASNSIGCTMVMKAMP
jgi:hypothetical protein